MTDWFDKAAPAVLALDGEGLASVAVPISRATTHEERILGSLALLELARREALGDAGKVDHFRDLLSFHEHEVDRRPHADAHGFGKRIAKLVRARPMPPACNT